MTPSTISTALPSSTETRARRAPPPAVVQPMPARFEIEQFEQALHDLAQRIEAADPRAERALSTLLDRLQAHHDPSFVALYAFILCRVREYYYIFCPYVVKNYVFKGAAFL